MLKYFVTSFAALGLLMGVAQADGPLTSKLEAYIVSVDADGVETLTPTEEITPGETIEYALTYENIGANALSGLMISAPVPASTIFVEGSAKTDIGSTFEVSIDDGATWSVPPLKQMIDQSEITVPASEYDMVRWVPEGAIESGNQWRFEYRTTVQ